MFSASCKVGFATEKELFETPGGWVEQGECVHATNATCTSNRTDQSKYIYLYSSFYTIVILKIYSKTAWIVNTVQCLQIQLQPSSRKVATNKQGSSCNTLQLPFMLWERGHIKCVLFSSCHCVVGSFAVCWLFSKPTLITFR